MSLRRRLVLFSAPVMLVALVAAVKMISVVVAGNSAVTNFSDGDAAALSRDTSTLNALNVVEPAKAPFAAGALAVLQGRLDEADEHFSEALSRTDAEQSCPVLVNLELVRERRGDIDGWEGRPDEARERYRRCTGDRAGCAGRLLREQRRSRPGTPSGQKRRGRATGGQTGRSRQRAATTTARAAACSAAAAIRTAAGRRRV